MFSNGRSAILLALATCVVGQFSPSSGVDATAANPNIIPDHYIVETSHRSILEELGDGGNQRRSFYDRHRKRDIPFAVKKAFHMANIFTGAVLEVPNGEDISALSEIDGVLSVKLARRYSAPKPASLKSLTDQINSTASGPLSIHTITGVDKAHAQGLTGKGIKIGIIDSGIDYTDPLLGGGFGPGFKVGGGWDFVGDDYDGSNTPMPDSNPLDQCNGIGTHLAGVIGANPGNAYNISGVAYGATLYAYRIFGCKGKTDIQIVIGALLTAFNDGMDIIMLSLDNPDSGFSEDPVGVIASKIARLGTVVIMPTGNDGRGAWNALAPATGKDVIAVGSIENPALEGWDTKGIMSSFSSSGPTYELDFKPSLSAPGGEILSTLPRNTSGSLSGTNIATSFVAGSAALVLQARGNTKDVRLAMRDILESTASPIASDLKSGKPPQTLIRSGAGLIQVYQAANTRTLVQPGHLTLNDTAHFQSKQEFTIKNVGTLPSTYNLTHAPAGTLYTYDGTKPVLPPFTLTTDSATVKFSPSTFTLDPGQSSIVTASFTPPTMNPKGYPAYSGHIEIKNSMETVRVPYLGVLGSVHDIQPLDRSDAPFHLALPIIQRPDGSVQNSETQYTFANGDYPTLVARLAFGSPLIKVNLVTVEAPLKAFGNLVLQTFNPRTLVGDFLNITLGGTFSNGTTIPNGRYRFLLGALKMFGNTSVQSDWDTYLSSVIVKTDNVTHNKTTTPP